MMKMQLQVYLGAYLKNPSNVMVIPDCHFEGITGGGAVDDDNNFGTFSKTQRESADQLAFARLYDVQNRLD